MFLHVMFSFCVAVDVTVVVVVVFTAAADNLCVVLVSTCNNATEVTCSFYGVCWGKVGCSLMDWKPVGNRQMLNIELVAFFFLFKIFDDFVFAFPFLVTVFSSDLFYFFFAGGCYWFSLFVVSNMFLFILFPNVYCLVLYLF